MNYIYFFIAGAALDRAFTRGWLKLAYEWIKTKATERKPTVLPLLDEANAAPKASPADKQKFSMAVLYICVALFGALAVAFSIAFYLKKYPKVEPISVVTQPAVIVATPPSLPPVKNVKPLIKENAKILTKPKEKSAVDWSDTIVIPPKAEAEPLSDFDKRVLNFERKMP